MSVRVRVRVKVREDKVSNVKLIDEEEFILSCKMAFSDVLEGAVLNFSQG